MYKAVEYVSKKPDENGFVSYTQAENDVWRDLYARQIEIVKNRACAEYLKGLSVLNLTQDKIPQIPDVNKALNNATGWGVAPVAALIQFEEFFQLLANKRFPAATFIRTKEDFDYIKEPDIFHELFGHCPLLTDPVYAEFMQKYGELGVNATHKERIMLARLYWFTVEFGLINTKQGLHIFGGGILSSKSETIYAVESDIPQRHKLTALEALRTPFRIDILQPIYFVIDDFHQLYDLVNHDLLDLITKAKELGDYPPLFERDGKPANEKIEGC